MRLRTVLSLVNLVAILVAFLVLFEFPAYTSFAFYALVGWIVVGFVLMSLPRVRGAPAGPAPSSPGPFGGPGGAPLPSTAAATPPSSLDFCVWCGATLPAGASACPACGRRVTPV